MKLNNSRRNICDVIMNWDTHFMTLVYAVAMKSKDESTHIGAVVVGPDKEIRTTGYNSFPRGIDDNKKERQERPEKYFFFEHAERNSIYNAARMGISLKGCTMYTNGVPCADCGRAIIQSGIKKVIVHAEWEESQHEDWKESTTKTMVMFTEANVELKFLHTKIPMLDCLFRGKKVTDVFK